MSECHSRGVVLVVGDDPGVLEPAGELARRLKVVAFAPGIGDSSTPGVVAVGGRIVGVSGRLGSFRARAAAAAEPVDVGIFSPNGDGLFDLVLDRGAAPLLAARDTPVGYFAPRSTAAFADALAALPGLVGTFQDPRHGSVRVREPRCTLCEACANVCPTHALSAPAGVRSVLLLRESGCVLCGKCAAACPESALSLAPRPVSAVAAGQITLVDRPRPRCPSCGDRFAVGPVLGEVRETGAGLSSAMRAAMRLCPGCRARSLFR